MVWSLDTFDATDGLTTFIHSDSVHAIWIFKELNKHSMIKNIKSNFKK